MQNPFETIQHLAEQMNWVNQMFGPDTMAQMRDTMKTMKESGERVRRSGPGLGPGLGTAPGQAGGQPAGPPLELYVTPDAVVLCAVLPGLTRPEHLRVSLLGPTELLLEAFLQPRSLQGQLLHQERFAGYCHRTVTLPAAIVAEGGTASYSDGILTATFPRLQRGGAETGVAVLQVQQP